jgi:hypothetical protein
MVFLGPNGPDELDRANTCQGQANEDRPRGISASQSLSPGLLAACARNPPVLVRVPAAPPPEDAGQSPLMRGSCRGHPRVTPTGPEGMSSPDSLKLHLAKGCPRTTRATSSQQAGPRPSHARSGRRSVSENSLGGLAGLRGTAAPDQHPDPGDQSREYADDGRQEHRHQQANSERDHDREHQPPKPESSVFPDRGQEERLNRAGRRPGLLAQPANRARKQRLDGTRRSPGPVAHPADSASNPALKPAQRLQ